MPAADILAELPSRIGEVIARHVAERPDHPAFVENGRVWSYRAFADAVDAVTADFARLHIRPRDRVLLASENSVALAAFVFACSKLDAWAVVTNPRLSPRELDQIHVHSGARRILITAEISKEAADHAARLRAELREIGPFTGIGVGALNETTQPEPVAPDGARQVAALMYTSGTTGQPKGVMLSHRNVLFAARTSVLLRGTAPSDRIYAVLPMSHIVGFTIILVSTMMAGATAHVVPKYDPAALAKAIAEDSITDLFGVPGIYQRLLEFKAIKGLARLERGQLRRMLVAGAPLDLNLKARVEEEFGQPLLNNYGITECSPGLTGVRADAPRSDESVGKFLPGVAGRQLTSYKRPCEIVLLDSLPAASTGKILKHKLWEAARAAKTRADAPSPAIPVRTTA